MEGTTNVPKGPSRLGWRRVTVAGRYAYDTNLDVRVGDIAYLPNERGGWFGIITALESDYQGACRPILAAFPEERKVLAEERT